MIRQLAALALVAAIPTSDPTPATFAPQATPTCNVTLLYNNYGKPFGGRSTCYGTFLYQYVVVGCGNGTATLATVTGPIAHAGQPSTRFCPWYFPRANWASRKLYT